MDAVLQPLGQQELEPPAPRRTIKARPGATWWGVDPSVERIAIGWVKADGSSGVATRSFAKLREGERLAHIGAETQRFAVELVAEAGHPGFVWVEQPFSFGRPVPPVSYMVQGVMMAALFHVTRAQVEACKPPSTWKSLALGKGEGNANKARVMEWALSNGYRGRLQDEADALAMAVAASRAVAFA